MPTVVKFEKLQGLTAPDTLSNESWQATAIVSATVVEQPRNVVPHYAFGGTYFEVAACPPPYYASVNIACGFEQALQLIGMLTTKSNFKPMRLHGFVVQFAQTIQDKSVLYQLSMLPQHVTVGFDFTVPELATISTYGPVYKLQETGQLEERTMETAIPQRLGASLSILGSSTANIETVTFRVNFVQDQLLTSLGPYIRCFGIQPPELNISLTTKAQLKLGANEAELTISAGQTTLKRNILLTNLAFEPISGFQDLKRYSIQAVIA